MKTTFYVFMLISFMTSCKKDNITNMNIDTAINILLLDSTGQNLLSPNNKNAFDTNGIKIFYKNAEGRYPYSNNTYFHEYKDEYFLRLFADDAQKEGNGEIIIEWDLNSIDTLQYYLEKENNSSIVTNIWFNNETVKESFFDMPRVIKIIREKR